MKHKWLRVFLSTVVALVVSGGLVAEAIPATAVTPTVVPSKASSFKPTSKQIFNNPRGSRAQEYSIVNEVISLAGKAPRGAKIRVAFYWFDLVSVADAFIAADSRGVQVKVLLDKKFVKRAGAKKLRSAFKRGGKSKSSVFYRSSGMQMHAKFVLVSKSGKAKNIAAWGSANMSKGNAANTGNDFRIKVNSPNYGCLTKAFDRMYKGNTKGTTCESKGLLTQLTPAKGANLWTTRGLNRIKCTRGTQVRASFMQWSDVAVAKAFVRKQAEGCDVQLLVSRTTSRTRAKVFTALKSKTKHGRVKVFVPTSGNGLHYKWLAVRGRNQAWIMTGSLHPSKGSQNGIQLVVREDSRSLADRYMDQFKRLTTNALSDLRK